MRRKLKLLIPLLSLSFLTACSGFLFDAGTPAPSAEASPEPSATALPAVPGRSQNDLFGVAWDESESLNPIFVKNKYNRELSSLIYEGLFAVDETFEPEGLLCESWSVSGNVWSFQIRKGVLFQDGAPFTAKDAAYSLRLAVTDASPYAARLGKVTDISADGDYTLTVTLSGPEARFPALLDIPVIEKNTGDDAFPPGTGPYYPETNGEDTYLQANAGWWRKKTLPVGRIQLVAGKDAETLIYNFEAGIVDLLSVDTTGISPLGLRGDCEAWEYPTTDMQYLGFNVRRAPLNNPAVRRAIGFAVDRQSIASSVMLGRATPCALPVPPQSELYDETLGESYGFNLSNLSSLLHEAGIEDTDSDGVLDYGTKKKRVPLSLSLVVGAENAFKVSAAQKIADTLGKVGVPVTVRELKWSDYVKALETGDFDLYYAETVLSCDFSPDFLVHTKTQSRGLLNYGGYSEADTDALLDAFERSGSGSDASALYKNIAENAPVVPILFKMGSVYTHRGQIRGIAPVQDSLYGGISEWTVGR